MNLKLLTYISTIIVFEIQHTRSLLLNFTNELDNFVDEDDNDIKPEADEAYFLDGPGNSVSGLFDGVDPSRLDESDRDNIHFHLYTRDNPIISYQLYVDNIPLLKASPFNHKHKTKVLIHGCTNTLQSDFVQTIKNYYLGSENVKFNVIAIDWSNLCGGPLYYTASINIIRVGKYVARFVDTLVKEIQLKLNDLHIVGHGLGAHTAGIVGKHFTSDGKISYITGFDPVLPLYSMDRKKWRLTTDDAQFVNIIHTSGGDLKFSDPIRHADFYLNRGQSSLPGCGFDLAASWTEPEVRQFTSGNIVAGTGYSSDSQQVVPQVCYNATVSSTSGQQGYIQLDTALSFAELENKLGISVSISGKFGMFSADAKASYLRSVQDKDYSLSLNYYEYATNNVAVQIADSGESALTGSGRHFYNGGKNPYFGLLCGDHYISSYRQGALLTMGLNIKFSSSNAKNEFEEKAGVAFGDIVSAVESIKTVVTEYKITGTVVIQAFQMGGTPSQLSKILNKDSTGQYYVLTCSLTAMDQCIKAASGLLDYAKDKFSTQFSFENNTGLTPLGIAFSEYNPIEYLGLIPPAKLATQEVLQYRDELSSRLQENQYYQQKFYPFFNKGYPGELHTNFINKAKLILSKANSNVGVLMQAHGGAVDCFNFPEKCKNIKACIDSQLHNITISDLKFLDAMKYTITTLGGMFYNTGSGDPRDVAKWSGVPNNTPGKEMIVKVYNLSITDERYYYDTDVNCPDDPVSPGILEFNFEGNFNSSLMEYVGTICPFWINRCKSNYPEAKLISPFFFEVYNVTEWKD